MSEEGTIVKSVEAAAAPLLAEGNPIVERAAAFIVDGPESYTRAGEMSLDIKRIGDAIYKLFDDPCKDANALHKKLTGLRGTMHGPFKTASGLLAGKAGAWKREDDERVRREQEAAERARQEAAAEQARTAEELRKANMPEAAEAMIAETPPPLAPVVRSEVPKVKGISHRQVWRARIVDELKIDRAYLMPNMKAIDGAATSMGKLAEEKVGGIEVYQDTITARRTG